MTNHPLSPSDLAAMKARLEQGYANVGNKSLSKILLRQDMRKLLLAYEASLAEGARLRDGMTALRRRVWNYMNEDYDRDNSYAVDIMEDFLKLHGSSLPHKESDLRTGSRPADGEKR